MRLGQSAGGSLVSYGSAALVVALDVAVALVQLPLALPGYIYTLLIGLAVGIVIACIAGKHQHFEFKSIGLLEKLEIFSMASIITIPADKKEEDFPFPGGATFKLYKLSLGDLKDLLRDYKQPVSGNKATVLLRLVDFSGNPAAWNETVAGRRRSHKGPRNVSNAALTDVEKKPKKKSQVVARRDELMGELPPTEPAPVVQRSKDTRTPQQISDSIAWAENILVKCPDIQRPCQELPAIDTKPKLDSRLATIKGQLQVLLSTVQGGSISNAMSVDPEAPTPMMHLPSPTPILPVPGPAAATSLPLNTTSPPSVPDVTVPPPPLPPLVIPGLPSAMSPPAPDSMLIDSANSGTESTPESTKVLLLGNGTRLEFLSSDVPCPLILSFAKDIPKLGRVWDDTRPEFSPSECSLKIKGHAIAVKYWPIAYAYSRDKRWSGVKSAWDRWKWVVEYYHRSTPENFWREFTHEDGHRMTFTAISRMLLKQRTEANQYLVQQQQEMLGCGFSQQFQVRGKVMVRPSAIAKRIGNGHLI